MQIHRFGVAAALISITLAGRALPAAAALSDQELSCSAAVAKNFAKLQTQILKVVAKCHADDVSAKTDDPNDCDPLPAKAQEKVDKAKVKFVSSVAKSCASVCSISNDKACINDLTCPPKHTATPANNNIAERCTGKGGSDPFNIANLDFPGPYCESILGHRLQSTSDLGNCLAVLASSTAGAIDQAVYADLDQSSALSGDTRKCVSSIDKAVQRAAARAYTATAACRDARRSAGNAALPPYACALTDEPTIAAIDEEITKLEGAIAKSCVDADIAALTGLCAAGGATPSTVADAQSCIGDMVREIATEEHAGDRRVWAPISMLNATHPNSTKAYCGDGIVTADREERTSVGEECDGSDAPCGSGHCLPPGDVFQCTCDSTPRERFIVDGQHADSDAGWIGSSHDATHNDGFGWITELSNCDCSEFSEADCIGSASDPVCDVYSNMAPRCSDDVHGSQTCDQHGNNNGIPENWDCNRCDDNSLNAGTWCANASNSNETVCQSQCFDDTTQTALGTPCQTQADCGAGKTCKGRCDNSITCNTMTEGSPLPLVSAATPVCIQLEYKTDITGTKDMVTGSSEFHYATRNNIQLGLLFAKPCPVCGGVCVGGTSDGAGCFGRCDVSGDSCLVDGDCTGGGDTACLESAADCSGGYCSLDLRCSAGSNQGRLCDVDSHTPLGDVSRDCPPNGPVLSGTGVPQNFGTVTTGEVELPVGGPCSDPTWDNFDCPCPADDGLVIGVPTRPNSCAGACDGGVNYGQGCAVGNGGSGNYTRCVGGSDANKPCDEDSDCDGGGTCSQNPLECIAGTPSTIGFACTTNANCGIGGVCGDACPGARCVPLCFPEGKCVNGARDGDPCATTQDCKECTAGNPALIGTPCDSNSRCNSTPSIQDGVCGPLPAVTCTVSDPEDGVCAAGPIKFRCNGEGYTTIPCNLSYGKCTGGACELGTPALHGTSCSANSDCIATPNVPVSVGCETGNDALPGTVDDIPGAGVCEPRPEDCFVNNGYAVGGGTSSAPELNATFCVPPNATGPINTASGFGGPSRIRRGGRAIVNVPSIP